MRLLNLSGLGQARTMSMSSKRACVLTGLLILGFAGEGVSQARDFQTIESTSPLCPGYQFAGKWLSFSISAALDQAVLHLNELAADGELPFQAPASTESLRVLESPTASAICQKLNERYKSNLDLQHYIGDPFDGIYPVYQPLYFAYAGYYFAYLLPYTPEPPEGYPPMVSTGIGFFEVFDSNLNLLYTSGQ